MEARAPETTGDRRAGEEGDTAPGARAPSPPSLDRLAAGPIFVVGHPRSGTTWVYDMLTCHPEVAGVLESWLFTRATGLARLFDDRLWGEESVARQRATVGAAVGLADLLTRDELRDEVRDLAGRVLGRALEPHHRYLVEKTPTPYTDVELVMEVFPEARLVHVVRDGRDMAVSLRAAALSWNPGWQAFAGDAHLRRLRALHRSSESWALTVRGTRGVGRRLGARHLEVRYEDLQAAPDDAARRIFDFCQIPHDPQLIEDVGARTDFDRQFKGGEDEFRRRGRTGEWRERFGVIDGLLFELGSRAALRELGYEPNRLWWATSSLPPRGTWTRAAAAR